MRPSVYLAGPICGLDFGEATDWREKAHLELSCMGIQAYSPMRWSESLRAAGPISATCDEYADPLLTSRGITTRDRFDVMRCDLVLACFLGAKKPIIGTVMEFAWADMLRKPIVLVAAQDDYTANHGMVKEVVGYRTTTLDEALDIVRRVLLP